MRAGEDPAGRLEAFRASLHGYSIPA